MKTRHWILVGAWITAAAIAQAQPADDLPTPPDTGSAAPSGSAAPTDTAATAPTPPPTGTIAHAIARTNLYAEPDSTSQAVYRTDVGEGLAIVERRDAWIRVATPGGATGWILVSKLAIDGEPRDPYGDAPPPPRKPERIRPKDPRVDMPVVLTTPTGWLLPAAVLYSRTSLDTGGGFSSDNRVGLGDVAEFGVATADNIRIKDSASSTSEPSQIEPYVTASFRMGVAENRLFENQPGLVLGFVKSFERTSDGFQTRVAQLTLVQSKHLGKRFAFHAGVAFWDAEISGAHSDGTSFDETLHGYNDLSRQLRAFGGLEARPFDRSEILVDLGWAPVFCKDCADGSAIELRPELSWGVRYEVTDYMRLESGVRVPDIGDFNLLNAQIFGQVTFTTWGLRHVVDDLK